MRMLNCRVKFTQKKSRQKNLKIGLTILENFMLLMVKISGLAKLGMIIREYTSNKNNDKHFDYSYYIVYNKIHAITTNRQQLQGQCSENKEIVVIVNSNSVHGFNHFEEEDHVESYKYHFRLNDLARNDLDDMAFPVVEW